MAQAPIIEYDAYIISPGYNLEITSVGTPTLKATYDDFPTDASGIAAHCTLRISYTNVRWTVNPDNSVTVTGNIVDTDLVRTATGVSSSQSQKITTRFNNSQTFQQTVSTASSGSYNLNIPNSFSVTVQPSLTPQPTRVASIEFTNDNTSSGNPPDKFFLGIVITNPNPPDYRPGAIRNNSGVWLSHNRSGGSAHIRNSAGKWIEMRTIAGLVESDNPPSIRVGNKWFNQRKLGKE